MYILCDSLNSLTTRYSHELVVVHILEDFSFPHMERKCRNGHSITYKNIEKLRETNQIIQCILYSNFLDSNLKPINETNPVHQHPSSNMHFVGDSEKKKKYYKAM